MLDSIYLSDKTDQTTVIPPQQRHDGRLPRDIAPVRYSVELFPDIYGNDPEAFSFSGNIWINLKCISRTNKVILNINKIELIGGTIQFGSINNTRDAPNFVRFEIDTKWHFLTIFLDGFLKPNNEYYLRMNFTGPLKPDFAGFYLSTFRLKDANR